MTLEKFANRRYDPPIIKMESNARASHGHHTLTSMKLKYGGILLRYVVIMIPAHARRRDTSAPTFH